MNRSLISKHLILTSNSCTGKFRTFAPTTPRNLPHRPVAFKKEESDGGKLVIDMDLTENPYPTWKKLEEMVDKGKVRNIGVSK
jgi:hypothetical protein